MVLKYLLFIQLPNAMQMNARLNDAIRQGLRRNQDAMKNKEPEL